jgi:hypothetical protein
VGFASNIERTKLLRIYFRACDRIACSFNAYGCSILVYSAYGLFYYAKAFLYPFGLFAPYAGYFRGLYPVCRNISPIAYNARFVYYKITFDRFLYPLYSSERKTLETQCVSVPIAASAIWKQTFVVSFGHGDAEMQSISSIRKETCIS